MMVEAVLIAQLAASAMLVGIIWMVELLTYPAFAQVPAERFRAHHERHSRLITPVVAPAILVQASAAVAVVVLAPAAIPTWLAWSGLGLVATSILVTALVSVSDHAALARGRDEAALARLRRRSRIRTVAWTLMGVVAIAQLWLQLAA